MVVVPDAIRDALERHAHAERPNEACGLVVLRDGVAERYVEGRNTAASPYRFELDVDPETWFLEDEGFELAVFHSHLSAPPRPSRTDVENVGLWAGRPYLIYTVRTGELAAWRIEDGHIEPLSLDSAPAPVARSRYEAAVERPDASIARRASESSSGPGRPLTPMAPTRFPFSKAATPPGRT